MLVLGLGTNLGSSLENLRQAIKLLRENKNITVLKISSLYKSDALLPENAPSNWNQPFLNLAVACETELSPDEILIFIKTIEKKLGREQTERWSPRIIDIDILAWDNLVYKKDNLQIPHKELLNRPFALWPLLDLMPNWEHPAETIPTQFSNRTSLGTQSIPHRIDASTLVGILNITPDSFSDGGLYNSAETALAQAQKLFDEGAEIIDIGAESTRPGSTPVSPAQEWQALQPIINAINTHWRNQSFKPKISIDTRHYETAEKALALNIDWINDVTGFADPAMQQAVAQSSAKCVVMHNLGVPPTRENVLSTQPDPCQQVLAWAEQRLNSLLKAGIKPEQLIFDIGIGFGKTPQQTIYLLNNIEQFKQLNIPLLVGHSRKSFLNMFGEKLAHERDLETAILSYHLAQHGVDYLRVHNAKANAQAVKMAGNMCSKNEL